VVAGSHLPTSVSVLQAAKRLRFQRESSDS